MKFLSSFKNLRHNFRLGRSCTTNNNSFQLPLDLANRLINDRVEFKLYATEQELDSLKQLEKSGSNPSSSNIHRVIWEMKIECSLAHLVGSVDALLVRINDKLGLGLGIRNVNSGSSMSQINQKLNDNGKGNLLTTLNEALEENHWFWILKGLRNQGLHRSLINIQVKVSLYDDINTGKGWSDRNKVLLKTDPQTDLEIIPYLEDSINKTKILTENIIKSEPLLKM